MRSLSKQLVLAMTVLSCSGPSFSQEKTATAKDDRRQVQKREGQFMESARAYQRELDVNPSSAKAHEGLGVALFRQLVAQGARPSDYNDLVERAAAHLKEASQLQPTAPGPLFELSDLEAFLAERSPDLEERNSHYKEAQDLLKRVLSLAPPEPETYLRLANLEHDQFGPPLQEAKARFSKIAGPIPDAELRHSLQQNYGATIDDAISNAQQASAANARLQRPLWLLVRLFRERALVRDTQDQYATDMQSAKNWEQQFLTTGGHFDSTTDKSR
jgi:tetratricopeptide (TPR) repeat protein